MSCASSYCARLEKRIAELELECDLLKAKLVEVTGKLPAIKEGDEAICTGRNPSDSDCATSREYSVGPDPSEADEIWPRVITVPTWYPVK